MRGGKTGPGRRRNMILIFSGTTEGRKLAEILTEQGAPCTVSTATEYGGELMEPDRARENLTIHTGRLDLSQMYNLMRKGGFVCVVDATHPFAKEVSQLIRSAAGQAGIPYYRLRRRTFMGTEDVHMVDSLKEAAEFLRKETVGNILVTTGSKEISDFTRHFPNKDRLYARILPLPESLAACKEAGIRPDHLLAMQGPFSQEMNEAVMRQIKAEALLTKESGQEGGLKEKLSAARALNLVTVIIRNPENIKGTDYAGEEGYTPEEITEKISELLGRRLIYRQIILAGIGPGSLEYTTLGLRKTAIEADLVFGAESILKMARKLLKLPNEICIPEYDPDKVMLALAEHPAAVHVLVLLSGDPGFYSGAEKLYEAFRRKADAQVLTLPGLSCMSYFMARIRRPWQNVHTVSHHGRECDLPAQLHRHEEVFLLLSGPEDMEGIAGQLREGFTEEERAGIRIWYGYQLSREDEEIREITLNDLAQLKKPGLYVLYLTRKKEDMPEEEGTSQLVRIPRVMIAAPKSGSGKTVLTAALLRLFSRQDKKLAACKCGPDYIDPMFHRTVLGIPSINLDTYFTDQAKTRRLFAVHAIGCDLALVEGVMGFEDGLADWEGTGSSAHLARVLNMPVILCVEAKGMSRSVIPLIRGFMEYGEGKRIRGIILNRVSPKAYALLKDIIEKELPVSVLGYIPEHDTFRLESRYLGLVQPFETRNLSRQIDEAAAWLEQTLDLEGILKIAQEAPGMPLGTEEELPQVPVRIAVARDEAFSFIYEDNLRLLKRAGAEILPFSPLREQELPDADGLILPGGYPELYASGLSANEPLRNEIRARGEAGMPILAECGGFVYLMQDFEDENGRMYPMVGLLPGRVFKTEHLVRFGYASYKAAEGSDGGGWLPAGEEIRGHEFHYYDCTENGTLWTARKPGRNESWECMQGRENILAGFPHLYYESDPDFAIRFLNRCLEEKKRRTGEADS